MGNNNKPYDIENFSMFKLFVSRKINYLNEVKSDLVMRLILYVYVYVYVYVCLFLCNEMTGGF